MNQSNELLIQSNPSGLGLAWINHFDLQWLMDRSGFDFWLVSFFKIIWRFFQNRIGILSNVEARLLNGNVSCEAIFIFLNSCKCKCAATGLDWLGLCDCVTDWTELGPASSGFGLDHVTLQTNPLHTMQYACYMPITGGARARKGCRDPCTDFLRGKLRMCPRHVTLSLCAVK